jgi:DNA processing protein
MLTEELLYQVGLTLINGIGDGYAKSLLAYCGSARTIFESGKATLLKIPGIGEYAANAVVHSKEVLKEAEKELRFMEENHVQPLFYTDPAYPQRLKYCHDSPILLYYKGNADLNTAKIISIVGTRLPTEYGIQQTEKFISELRGSGILIVSGLAYGIDILSHKRALENDLDTVGVVAHGHDQFYPKLHEPIARKMYKKGGILTDFKSGTNPDAVNFPKRNRIVAGMCDALIVMESKRDGGSLITATIANSYNKDVFAFPGRANDPQSEGCNAFIKMNRASLIENAADLFYQMGWNTEPKQKTSNQIPLPLNLSADEQKIVTVLSDKKQVHMDEISYASSFPVSKVASLLLQLEFSNIVRSLPGKMYSLISS